MHKTCLNIVITGTKMEQYFILESTRPHRYTGVISRSRARYVGLYNDYNFLLHSTSTPISFGAISSENRENLNKLHVISILPQGQEAGGGSCYDIIEGRRMDCKKHNNNMSEDKGRNCCCPTQEPVTFYCAYQSFFIGL